MWSGLGCNNSSISTTINNATTETNLAVQSYILETSCFPLVLSRIIFYALFLLLSSCLLFSFVRHHVKYNRFDILRCKSNIATERHRVVIAMSLGCFFRSLSFVVDGEYLYNSDVAFYVHVFLRVLKDICYVQSFSLVVVFWLTLLKTVGGGRTSHGNSRSHRHQFLAHAMHTPDASTYHASAYLAALEDMQRDLQLLLEAAAALVEPAGGREVETRRVGLRR